MAGRRGGDRDGAPIDAHRAGDPHRLREHIHLELAGPAELPIDWDASRLDLLLRVAGDFSAVWGGGLDVGVGAQRTRLDLGPTSRSIDDLGPVFGGELLARPAETFLLRTGVRALLGVTNHGSGSDSGSGKTTSLIANVIGEWEATRNLALFAGLQVWHLDRDADGSTSELRLTSTGPVFGLTVRLGDTGWRSRDGGSGPPATGSASGSAAARSGR